MNCGSTKQKIKAHAIGDMRNLIELYERNINRANDDGVDFGENFTLIDAVWAKLITVRGKTMFDSTNTETEITHEFYIRYIDLLDRDAFNDVYLLFEGEYYRILRVDHLDERKRFMRIDSVIRGDAEDEVNLT
jgi:SPP1 family predicted phage head-tail adaptor